MNKVFFFSADKPVNARNRSLIKNLIVRLFKQERASLNRIDYISCSDDYLLKINQQFLHHETYTDIITFPLSEKSEPIRGEIYISVDRIKENAKAFKVPYQNELLRVMIHGALHLCGYTDHNTTEKQKMRSKEDYYLNQFAVSRETNT
ncbi:MAG TPA: rRNA maturation RNase YbeY [Parafilimonas sp.]|nr:rRNA maturation RNase YbeY [Parafilimonas sp.]